MLYQGTDITVECSAITRLFIKAREDEVEGGTLYTYGFPDLQEAAMIISSKLTKIVASQEPLTSDELCALEILKESNLSFIINPKIIL